MSGQPNFQRYLSQTIATYAAIEALEQEMAAALPAPDPFSAEVERCAAITLAAAEALLTALSSPEAARRVLIHALDNDGATAGDLGHIQDDISRAQQRLMADIAEAKVIIAIARATKSPTGLPQSWDKPLNVPAAFCGLADPRKLREANEHHALMMQVCAEIAKAATSEIDAQVDIATYLGKVSGYTHHLRWALLSAPLMAVRAKVRAMIESGEIRIEIISPESPPPIGTNPNN